jgi:hypothetical protein
MGIRMAPSSPTAASRPLGRPGAWCPVRHCAGGGGRPQRVAPTDINKPWCRARCPHRAAPSIHRKPFGQPCRGAPLCAPEPPSLVPKAFPLGGRWPSAHTGSDEGRYAASEVVPQRPLISPLRGQLPPRGKPTPRGDGGRPDGGIGPYTRVGNDRVWRAGVVAPYAMTRRGWAELSVVTAWEICYNTLCCII